MNDGRRTPPTMWLALKERAFIRDSEGIPRYQIFIEDADTGQLVATIMCETEESERFNRRELQTLLALLSGQPDLAQTPTSSDRKS